MKQRIDFISISTKLSDPKITFRVPEKLRGELIYCAQKMGRTLNAEVMIRLIQSLKAHSLITEVPKVD